VIESLKHRLNKAIARSFSIHFAPPPPPPRLYGASACRPERPRGNQSGALITGLVPMECPFMSPVRAKMDRRRPGRYRDCRNSSSIDSLNWHLGICSIIESSDVNCSVCPARRSLISAILLLIKYAVFVSCALCDLSRDPQISCPNDRPLNGEMSAYV